MVRVAQERIADLFALAERESGSGTGRLADRYVRLARKIGTRYNVRLLPEYREVFCRACATYWVEGRTVRTRLRGGRRVRTCLHCGRQRRTVTKARARTGVLPDAPRVGVAQEDQVFVGPVEETPEPSEDDEGSEEA